MQNLHCRFDRYYIGQIYGGDFAKICGLLRIYELYVHAMSVDLGVDVDDSRRRRCRAKKTGGKGAGESPDFGTSVNPIPTGSRLCPPHYYSLPIIFGPSYGPERRGRIRKQA